jgi:hypothetical protein
MFLDGTALLPHEVLELAAGDLERAIDRRLELELPRAGAGAPVRDDLAAGDDEVDAHGVERRSALTPAA